jgi:hypothetical protein
MNNHIFVYFLRTFEMGVNTANVFNISSTNPSDLTITVNGGTYVKANVGFEALDMSSGEDYEAQTDAEA